LKQVRNPGSKSYDDFPLRLSTPGYQTIFMRTYLLEREQIIPLSRTQTFAFFGDALNLEAITPPFLHFRVLTQPPIEMQAGTLLDYRLSLFGISFNWQTLIEAWSPEDSFVDTQLAGPYKLWHHTHTFEELAPDKTLMRDRVLYRLPYGILGQFAHALFVKRALNTIFNYRGEMTSRLLTPDNPELDRITRAKYRGTTPDAISHTPIKSTSL
jgi:ligand-binding SRPBCC domain-containing protein